MGGSWLTIFLKVKMKKNVVWLSVTAVHHVKNYVTRTEAQVG